MRINETPIGLIYRGFNFTYYTNEIFLFDEGVKSSEGIKFNQSVICRAVNNKIGIAVEFYVDNSIKDTKNVLKKLIDQMFLCGIVSH